MAEAENTEPQANLIPLPNTKSKQLWEQFETENGQIKDKSVVKCRHCLNPVPYSGNTSNLRSHLAKYHLHVYRQLQDQGKAASTGKRAITPSRPSGQLGISDSFMGANKAKKWAKSNTK